MSEIRSVAVAILSWNGKAHLETCLEALNSQDDPGIPWQVYVFDNGSEDGTAAWLGQAFPDVVLIRSEVNLGFCEGNSRLASEIRADAIIFLNNDTRPQNQWLTSLVAALQAAPSDVAAVSGLILNWEGDRLDFGSGIMTFDAHAFQFGFGTPLAEAPVPEDGEELLFPCGGNMIIRRSSFERLGGFDDRYFAYLEDVDLGWRIWAAGERVTFSRSAAVHHRSMATSDLLGNNNRGFLFERNALLTAYKNFDEEFSAAILPAVLLTFGARTQALLSQNNPGGNLILQDPFKRSQEAKSSPTPPPVPPLGPRTLSDKWRVYGPGEFVVRAFRKAGRLLGFGVNPSRGRSVADIGTSSSDVVRVEDGRTLSQLRAHQSFLDLMGSSAELRAETQALRTRSDLEIFSKFPLWVVPTYPGDEALFASTAFRELLPPELKVRWATLEEVMRS